LIIEAHSNQKFHIFKFQEHYKNCNLSTDISDNIKLMTDTAIYELFLVLSI